MAMLVARDGDGRYVPFPLTVGTEPGEWRPAPPTNAFRSELVGLRGRAVHVAVDVAVPDARVRVT